MPISRLAGVKVEVIKIDGGRLQEFMNGCLPEDSERCVVEVQFPQMLKNIRP
jgi:hypothetical protein